MKKLSKPAVNKVTTLKEAVNRFVHDGSYVALVELVTVHLQWRYTRSLASRKRPAPGQ